MSSFKELISGDRPVLIDFYADWCQPCKMMAPILQEVASNMKDEVRIIKIDVDKNPRLANALGIQGVPSLIIYKDGESVWHQSGVVPSHQLVSTLKAYV